MALARHAGLALNLRFWKARRPDFHYLSLKGAAAAEEPQATHCRANHRLIRKAEMAAYRNGR